MRSRYEQCNWDLSVKMEFEESNYLGPFLPLTVIFDAINLA